MTHRLASGDEFGIIKVRKYFLRFHMYQLTQLSLRKKKIPKSWQSFWDPLLTSICQVESPIGILMCTQKNLHVFLLQSNSDFIPFFSKHFSRIFFFAIKKNFRLCVAVVKSFKCDWRVEKVARLRNGWKILLSTRMYVLSTCVIIIKHRARWRMEGKNQFYIFSDFLLERRISNELEKENGRKNNCNIEWKRRYDSILGFDRYFHFCIEHETFCVWTFYVVLCNINFATSGR